MAMSTAQKKKLKGLLVNTGIKYFKVFLKTVNKTLDISFGIIYIESENKTEQQTKGGGI